jgi:Zn-dependent peptidase ImmA (M78 family)
MLMQENKRLPVEIVGEFMKSAPVDVIALAASLGLSVDRKPMPDDVSGEIVCARNGPCRITVNSIHPTTRQRFTIAHEIAHYVLHRDLIGDGIRDSGLYRSRLTDTVEKQANRYAAEILMPWRLVIDAFSEGTRDATSMARRFNVSPAVAEIRMSELRVML